MFTCTVLEYVEGKWVCEGSGRQCAIGEETARKYMRDIVSGLTYLHAHVLSLNLSFCVLMLNQLSLSLSLFLRLFFQSQLV
jgi:hypothetical protein